MYYGLRPVSSARGVIGAPPARVPVALPRGGAGAYTDAIMRFMKTVLLASLLAAAPLATPAALARPYQFSRGPREAPPPPPTEEIVTRPGYIWIGGHYEWRGGHYLWVGGHLVRGRRNHAWHEGRWERHGRVWRWYPGRWRPHR